MSPAVEPVVPRTKEGVAEHLATLSGALLALLAVAVSLVSALDAVGRLLFGGGLVGPNFFEWLEQAGLAFAAVSVLALPAAASAAFVRRGDPPRRSRSTLALVPGCILSLAALGGAIVLVAAAAGLEVAVVRVPHAAVGAFASHVFLFVPLTFALSATLGGARTPESTAAAAAPAVMAFLFGYLGEVSIGRTLVALIAPMLVLALAWAVLFTAAPARAVLPWIAGPALVLALIVLAPGATTPTEAAALYALIGIVTLAPIRTLGLGERLGPMLRQAAMETAAVVPALIASVLLAQGFAYLGVTATVTEALGGGYGVLAGAAAAYLVLSYFLTPLFVLAVSAPLAFPLLRAAGYDLNWAGAVTTLLALAAIAANAGRGKPEGAALPPLAAWIGAATALGLALLVILVPNVALAPVRALGL